MTIHTFSASSGPASKDFPVHVALEYVGTMNFRCTIIGAKPSDNPDIAGASVRLAGSIIGGGGVEAPLQAVNGSVQIIASGTSPPPVTVTGTPDGVVRSLAIEIMTAGPLGVATFFWTRNDVVQATGVATAAMYALGSTGLEVHFPPGSYGPDNVFVCQGAGSDPASVFGVVAQGDPAVGQGASLARAIDGALCGCLLSGVRTWPWTELALGAALGAWVDRGGNIIPGGSGGFLRALAGPLGPLPLDA
jgi:hypothetical protein